MRAEIVLQECIARVRLLRQCIAIHKIVLQEKAGKARVVSQYIEVYCDCGVEARLDCIAIQCPAKP